MNIIVTCGPSYEPIDQVRRMTNFSTGTLGVQLSNLFAQAGHSVFCLKGVQAVAADPLAAVRLIRFTTNQDLEIKLQSLTEGPAVDAVFHAAALCDYRVTQTTQPNGTAIHSGKIPTRLGRILIELEPTLKVLPRLRTFFPTAQIAGWKFEVEGGRSSLLEKAREQMRTAQTNACVVNGPAWGAGFGFARPDGTLNEIPDSTSLGQHLLEWISTR